MSRNIPLFAVFLMTTILSCKKNEDNVPPDKYHVKTITTTGDNFQGTSTTTLTYNVDGLLHEEVYSNGVRFMWEYGNGLHIKEEYSGSGILTSRIHYYLDASSHIDSVVFYDGQGQVYQVARYIYRSEAVDELLRDAQSTSSAKVTHTRVSDSLYDFHGGLLLATKYFYSSRLTTTDIGGFKYGLPSENSFLLDSMIRQYGPDSMYPDSFVVFRYTYNLDAEERIVEKNTMQNGMPYQNDKYTYYP